MKEKKKETTILYCKAAVGIRCKIVLDLLFNMDESADFSAPYSSNLYTGATIKSSRDFSQEPGYITLSMKHNYLVDVFNGDANLLGLFWNRFPLKFPIVLWFISNSFCGPF